MKIAILTLGTRGDVQPFAVLGQALQRRGHQVVLSTAKNFASLVRSYGLDFVPVDVDFQALLDSEEGKRMMSNPFRARKHLDQWVYPMVYNSLVTFYGLAKESDKVLYHVKTLGDYFADQFPHKMIRANVVPAIEPTAAFVNPVFSAFGLPRFLNKFSYRLSALGMKMMQKPVRRFRLEAGLPPRPAPVRLPGLYGISTHFLSRPADYPCDSYFTGFWTAPSEEPLPEDLLAFVRSGEPPLLITFGSMPFRRRLNLPQALNRLSEEAKTRLIVIKGWGLTEIGELEKNPDIKVIDAAPYDKLFPLVRAVIHHGGIGTTAACLEAGKPFLVCPVLYPAGDQHFWGTVAWQRGVALKPVPLKRLTVDALIAKAKELLATSHLYEQSTLLMEQLKEEDGLGTAIGIIEKDLR